MGDSSSGIGSALSKRTALLAIVSFMAASGSFSLFSPAKAGLFDELFGVAAAPRFDAMEPHRRKLLLRRPVNRATVKSVAGALEAASDPTKRPLFCSWGGRASKPADRTEALMRDATLRPGDAVVTDEGVRVFEGRGACPHNIGDFRTLAEARALPRAERRALAAIEQATKGKPFGGAERPIVASDRTRRIKP